MLNARNAEVIIYASLAVGLNTSAAKVAVQS